MSDVRTLEELRTTANLIQRDGKVITLSRAADPVPDGAGGFIRPPSPTVLPSQRLFLSGVIVFNGVVMRRSVVQDTPDTGSYSVRDITLIGMPVEFENLTPADIEVEDTFTYSGINFKVIHMEEDRSFQVKAFARGVY